VLQLWPDKLEEIRSKSKYAGIFQVSAFLEEDGDKKMVQFIWERLTEAVMSVIINLK